MDTKVTILQRSNRLIKNAEPEISDLLKNLMDKRMDIVINFDASEVKKQGKQIVVVGKDTSSDKEKQFSAEKIMIATGRASNADLLKVENTGVEVDDRGFIKVNEYLETTKKHIWAFGNAIGKYMF